MSEVEKKEIKEIKKQIENNSKDFFNQKDSKKALVTKELLITSFGKEYTNVITDKVVDMINSEPDSDTREIFRESLLTFKDVLQGENITVSQYINATKYVTYRTQGDKQLEAFTRVFPDRFQKAIEKHGAEKGKTFLISYASSYNRSRAVTKILAKALLPNHIQYFDLNHSAMMHLANLMRKSKSEYVQFNAAKTIMEETRVPDDSQVLGSTDRKGYDPIKLVSDAIGALADKQMKAINKGMGITEATEVIIEASDNE